MTKAKVAKVEIMWSENSLLDKQKPDFSSLAIADVAFAHLGASLRRIGNHCNKTGFRITFTDGETYEGRIDVTSRDCSLQRHVVDFVSYCSGRRVPPTMRAEDVPGFMKAMGIDPEKWARFMDSREFN